MRTISRRTLIAALVAFAAMCVIRAPVSLLALLLPAQVQLKHVEGSFWQGRAAAIGIGGMIVQEGLAWDFRPQALLSGGLTWEIRGRLGDKISRLNLVLRPGGMEMDDVSLFLPLEPLAALHPKLKAAQLGALLQITASRWRSGEAARATVDVDRLSSALIAQAGSLGSYRFEVDVAADGKGTWAFSSLPGVLAVTGHGQLDAHRALINGRLVLTPVVSLPGLTPALAALPREGDGFQIVF